MRGPTVCSEQAVIFHNIQHTAHLTEYEDARPLGLHGGQQFVQDNHFSAVLDEVHVSGIRGARFLAESLALVLGRCEHVNVQPPRTGKGDKRLSAVA